MGKNSQNAAMDEKINKNFSNLTFIFLNRLKKKVNCSTFK